MPDAVTSQTLSNGSKRTIRKFTNISDSSGESNITKVDISGLTGTPTAVKIMQVWWITDGMNVNILFDHNTNDSVLVLGGYGYLDFRSFGGIPDPASTGGSGDILFTTIAASNDDTYTVILDIGIS